MNKNGVIRPMKLWQSMLFFLLPGMGQSMTNCALPCLHTDARQALPRPQGYKHDKLVLCYGIFQPNLPRAGKARR